MNKEEAVRAALGQVEENIACKVRMLNRDCDDDFCRGMVGAFNDIDLFIQNMDIDYKSSYEEDILDLINCLVLSDDNAEVKLQNALSEAFEEYLYNFDKSLVFNAEHSKYIIKDDTNPITLNLTAAEANYLYNAVNVAKEELMDSVLCEDVITHTIDKVYDAITNIRYEEA